MRTYYIYKATNKINNKVYIGCTIDFHRRTYQHMLLKPSDDCVFHRAIKKYGFDNFDWEIIDQTNIKNEANEKEKYYINKYRSCIHYEDCNGYNENYGNVGGHNSIPIVQLSLDGKFIKRYDSAAQIEREIGLHNSDVLVNCKNKSRRCGNYLFMYEKDYNKNGSKKYIPKTRNGCEKVIIQCDIDGNFIKKYESVTQASKETGIRRSTISGNITGTYKTAGGYIFVYENNYPIKNIEKYIHKKKGRKILQVDQNTNEILDSFDRVADAGRKLGVNYKSIHKVLDQANKTAFGYKWISQ